MHSRDEIETSRYRVLAPSLESSDTRISSRARGRGQQLVTRHQDHCFKEQTFPDRTFACNKTYLLERVLYTKIQINNVTMSYLHSRASKGYPLGIVWQ